MFSCDLLAIRYGSYHAMLCIRGTSHGPVSVRLCPSVTSRCFIETDERIELGFGGDAENARPENDGQRKLWVWKMQHWKMTDNILANSEQNYGV